MRTLLLLALTACYDPIYGEPIAGTDSPSTEEGFCAVQSILAGECVLCHDAEGPSAGLDLQTDPYNTLVGNGPLYGKPLVVAGDPDGSFLIVKLEGLQEAAEGTAMPPTRALDAADIEIVRTWIADGASSECGSIDTGFETYHPSGWDDPGQHGIGAKTQADDCQSCHGEALDGGDVGVSCDTCHAEGWRSTCTFCHGDPAEGTAAPPQGIRDETDAGELSFPPHDVHVSETSLKVAYECTECHVEPDDIFSRGHLFTDDTTAGRADVNLTAGLSSSGAWSGTGCSNLYCHGNGQAANGSVQATDTVVCGDCHDTREVEGSTLSGEHGDHLREGMHCQECHADAVTNNTTIRDVTLHINGTVDLDMGGEITWSGGTCTGVCHSENHRGEDWD